MDWPREYVSFGVVVSIIFIWWVAPFFCVRKGRGSRWEGQVDFLPAPLDIAPPITRPAPPNGFPWCSQAVGLNAESNGYRGAVVIAEI